MHCDSENIMKMQLLEKEKKNVLSLRMILVNGSIDVNGNISIYIEKRLYGYQLDLDTAHVILLNTGLPNTFIDFLEDKHR